MPNPIIARADALMQRRRQNGSAADDVPVLTDAIDDEEIPVLFNVDPPHFDATPPALNEPLPPTPPATSPEAELTFREALIREVAQRIERRLAVELPGLIAATVEEILTEKADTGEIR